MKQKDSYSLAELTRYLGGELQGDPACEIKGIAPLNKAQLGQISFLADAQYAKFLESTQASAIIILPKHAPKVSHTNLIILSNPYLAYAKTATLFDRRPVPTPGIHPSASIGQNCQIHPTAYIGAQCVIGDHVVIGENSIVHPGCVIGSDCSLGSHCQLWSNVTLYHHVTIGNRVIIHSGVVIGSDGFGMVNDNGSWYKIPQLGGVRIGDHVEIGANTSIDRGALDDTVIENGVKLDNLIQIAHNVHIGEHTVIAGCVGIAGSARIGKYCMIGGAACINGHIEIADHVVITATTAVHTSLTEPGIYSSGVPLQANSAWRRNAVRFLQLDDMARRLRKLEKEEK